MNRLFSTFIALISLTIGQSAYAQVALVTDCSNAYLVKSVQNTHNNRDEGYATFTYNDNRYLTSLTQGQGSQAATLNVAWTATSITYSYLGYEMVSATLNADGSTKSMTNFEGVTATFTYDDGYLVAYSTITEDGVENAEIEWQDGNPKEVRISYEDGFKITYKYTYSDTPNNTNIDFGVILNTEITTFPLPFGKGINNLPSHAEEYYNQNISERCDITYEFDSKNRPVKCISTGTDYEDGHTKDFTNTMVISYDENFVPLTIASPATTSATAAYNLYGQKVSGTAKGITIRNGRKVIVK